MVTRVAAAANGSSARSWERAVGRHHLTAALSHEIAVHILLIGRLSLRPDTLSARSRGCRIRRGPRRVARLVFRTASESGATPMPPVHDADDDLLADVAALGKEIPRSDAFPRNRVLVHVDEKRRPATRSTSSVSRSLCAPAAERSPAPPPLPRHEPRQPRHDTSSRIAPGAAEPRAARARAAICGGPVDDNGHLIRDVLNGVPAKSSASSRAQVPPRPTSSSAIGEVDHRRS